MGQNLQAKSLIHPSLDYCQRKQINFQQVENKKLENIISSTDFSDNDFLVEFS